MNTPAHVRIFDTTLRDGEQSPGCSMSPQQKAVMARALAELGVDIIETGFPASSQSDREAAALIARDLRETTLCVLSRCLPGDIEASARVLQAAAKPRLHVFLSTSPLHREHKLRMSKDEVLEATVRNVAHARSFVDDVEFSTEDGTRTEEDFLAEVIGAAHFQRHHQFLHRAIAGALADAVDGAFHLARAAFDGGQGIGHRHAQVVVAVRAEHHVFGARHRRDQALEQAAHLRRCGVAERIRHVDRRRAGRDGGAYDFG